MKQDNYKPNTQWIRLIVGIIGIIMVEWGAHYNQTMWGAILNPFGGFILGALIYQDKRVKPDDKK